MTISAEFSLALEHSIYMCISVEKIERINVVTLFLMEVHKIWKLSQIFLSKKSILERNICSLAWHKVAAVSSRTAQNFHSKCNSALTNVSTFLLLLHFLKALNDYEIKMFIILLSRLFFIK